MAQVKFWRPFSGGFNSHEECTTVTILYHPMPGGYAYVAIRNASAQTHNLFRYIHISLRQHAIYKISSFKNLLDIVHESHIIAEIQEALQNHSQPIILMFNLR
jgi:hypothetical protein